MHKIVDNLSRVRESVKTAALRAHRDPSSITLLAVSKTKPTSDIQVAHAAGQQDFGENYVQEAVRKIQELRALSISWHFIGPIQSNKTRDIAEYFDWVHTVDRLKVAERLSNQRPKHLRPIKICVQVNIDDEASKSGCTPDEALALCQTCAELPHLQLKGLMAIPKPGDSSTAFAHLNKLFQDINHQLPQPMDTLSMGMSADLETAIEHGSTMVRIGTAIFGSRST